MLINRIKTPTLRNAENILSKAGTEDIFEKAKHQDGDMHPNGKWVWVASANGGKGDWRTHGGRAHKKSGGQSGNQSAPAKTPQATTQPKVQPKKQTSSPKTDKERINTTKTSADFGELNKVLKRVTDDLENRKLTGFSVTLDPKYNRMIFWDAYGNNPTQVKYDRATYDKLMKHLKSTYDVETVKTNRLGASESYEFDVKKKEETTSASKPKKNVEKKDTTAKDTTQKKLRPVGTGTNGPERRTKEEKKNVKQNSVTLKSDWDISNEATKGLGVMLGNWGENKFKQEIEKNSPKELQDKIATQNKNIEKWEKQYKSTKSQVDSYIGTSMPWSLSNSWTAIREQLAIERCKKLHLENEIQKRKNANR